MLRVIIGVGGLEQSMRWAVVVRDLVPVSDFCRSFVSCLGAGCFLPRLVKPPV